MGPACILRRVHPFVRSRPAPDTSHPVPHWNLPVGSGQVEKRKKERKLNLETPSNQGSFVSPTLDPASTTSHSAHITGTMLVVVHRHSPDGDL